MSLLNFPSVLNVLPLILKTMLPPVTGFPYSLRRLAVNVMFSPIYSLIGVTVIVVLIFLTLTDVALTDGLYELFPEYQVLALLCICQGRLL